MVDSGQQELNSIYYNLRDTRDLIKEITDPSARKLKIKP